MNYDLASVIAGYLPDMQYRLPFFGETDVQPYVVALVVFAGLSLLFRFVQYVVVARLKVLSERTHTDIDDTVIDAVSGIRPWVYIYIAFFLSAQAFDMPRWLDIGLTALFLFAVVWQLIEIAVKFIRYGVQRFVEKDEDADGVVDPGAATASNMITLLARIVLWALGGIFVLSNLGIEVTSLIAGLGIGGIAIAFALQGILSDLFASFSIYFDKPFRIGDFIIIGDDMGTVEHIGIKSTRLRTLQGEELVVSNAELTTARVNNFKDLKERRIVMQFGVTYETPQEKVQEIPGMVRRIFDQLDRARVEWVHFTTYGDSALIFEVTYYVQSSDYGTYLDVQQDFNLELMRWFAEAGIEFAYPTQTVFVKQQLLMGSEQSSTST